MRVTSTSHDFTTPEYGAATQVWAAVTDELAGLGGIYLSDCQFRTAAW